MTKQDDVIEIIQLSNDTRVEIVYDTDPIDPREFSNLGTMVCAHSRYTLGDVQVGDKFIDGKPYFPDVESLKDYIQNNKHDIVSLPLYLYDHSGLTINTTGFSCPWDSGQVGYIYVTYEKLRSYFKSTPREIMVQANKTNPR